MVALIVHKGQVEIVMLLTPRSDLWNSHGAFASTQSGSS